MSSEGAAETPQGVPRELLRSFLGAKMEFGEAQKSSTEALKNLENDLKIKSLHVRQTIENSLKRIDYSSSEGQL